MSICDKSTFVLSIVRIYVLSYLAEPTASNGLRWSFQYTGGVLLTDVMVTGLFWRNMDVHVWLDSKLLISLKW